MSIQPVNAHSIELEIECEPYQVKEITKAVLHTILFHRCLIQSMPVDVDCTVVDATYVKCDHAFIEVDVDSAASRISALFDTPTPTPQTLDLLFFEKRDRKSWFFKAPHERIWERWRLRVKPRIRGESPEDRENTQLYLQRQLRSLLLYISTVALEYVEVLPGLTASPKPYSYRIQVHNGTPESLMGILRRMVADSSSGPQLLG